MLVNWGVWMSCWRVLGSWVFSCCVSCVVGWFCLVVWLFVGLVVMVWLVFGLIL